MEMYHTPKPVIDAHPLQNMIPVKIFMQVLSQELSKILQTLILLEEVFPKFMNGNGSCKMEKICKFFLLKLAMGIADSDPTLAQATAQSAISGGVFSSAADDALLPYAVT
jgi:hypothetical protein